jgi:hypothetical protein
VVVTREEYDPELYPVRDAVGTVRDIVAWVFVLHDDIESVEVQPVTPGVGDVTIIVGVKGTAMWEAALVAALAPELREEIAPIGATYHVKPRRDEADMFMARAGFS